MVNKLNLTSMVNLKETMRCYQTLVSDDLRELIEEFGLDKSFNDGQYQKFHEFFEKVVKKAFILGLIEATHYDRDRLKVQIAEGIGE